MATMDPVPYTHNHTINTVYTTGTTTSGSYYPQAGYQCGNCGQWIYGYTAHNCYYYASPPTYYPITQVIVTQGFPPPTSKDEDDAVLPVVQETHMELQEVKEELKEVRNLLQKLMDLAVNDHEEVRGRDEGRSEGEGAHPEGGLGGTLRIDVTAEVAKRLGL